MFSPYYALARRRAASAGAAGADPLDHCALNVALYEVGDRRHGAGPHAAGSAGARESGSGSGSGSGSVSNTVSVSGGGQRGRSLWTMTERSRAAVQRDTRTLRIGPSALAWHGDDTLVIDIDEIAVPWPARVRGKVTVTLPRRLQHTVQLAPGHRWSPIAPVARAAVEIGRTRWSGAGYLDSNHGDAPLEQAFHRWDWSRAHLQGGHGAVLYDVEPVAGPPTTLGLRFDADGSVTTLDADHAQTPASGWNSSTLPPTLWRVPRHARADRGADVALLQTLTDAPFYARSLIRTQWLGEPVIAVHESLSLRRFDTAWVQAMLPFRMPRRAGAGPGR